MELREIFNRDEADYDRYRPGYPAEVFTAIRDYTGVGQDGVAVEIGPGTGQATGPMLAMGCRVTAVELGDRLAAFLEIPHGPASGGAGRFYGMDGRGACRPCLFRYRLSLAAGTGELPEGF